MFRVIAQMAALAPCTQVRRIIVFRRVIEMRDSQNNINHFADVVIRHMAPAEHMSGFSVIDIRRISHVGAFIITSTTANTRMVLGKALLATMASTFKNRGANLFPILRVTCFVFGLDWHDYAAL